MPAATKKLTATDCAPASARRPRADAVRNRKLIVDAAADAFRELGLEASVAEIARRAGVGSGTLFRNFPSKEDLIYAVIDARMQEWSARAEQALEEPDAAKAFEQFMLEAAKSQRDDRGLGEAIKQHIIDRPELLDCKKQAVSLSSKILKRAQDAGAVRKDVNSEDLRFLINAAVTGDPLPGSDGDALFHRHLQIMLDGLRPAGARDL
jgi:AcrR family transcriptional regulator